jgi:L-seryl-tRNA(Ser) seleniumtransferase
MRPNYVYLCEYSIAPEKGVTLFKNIPKVDRILEWPGIKAALSLYPKPVIMEAVRSVLDSLRDEIKRGEFFSESLDESTITESIIAKLRSSTAPSLKRVVNGTGVVIHTNLGRSLLPETVREKLLDTAFSYTNLEFDIGSGERGSRYSHVEPILCRLTGAEAALVVNNNAAAVLLALSALARGKEVVVSRGELVEIGGSFRIPDVMRQSGAILKEVGATNRTHPSDYRGAIGPDTGLLLKVHPSNFAIVGFTSELSAAELVQIGRESGIPVMADMGSGNLFDLSAAGIPGEPMVQDFVKAGVDLVTFSGDKLLGGPQAGIIVGRRSYLEILKKHPLLRALRIDKLTLAALEETLRLYLDERQARQHIPTIRMLVQSADSLAARGRKVVRMMRSALHGTASISLVDGFSQAGGGSLPLLELPTKLLSISLDGISSAKLEQYLRNYSVPILGRVRQESFLLDLRTILDPDIPVIVSALLSIASHAK